jgi:hypothetical protein
MTEVFLQLSDWAMKQKSYGYVFAAPSHDQGICYSRLQVWGTYCNRGVSELNTWFVSATDAPEESRYLNPQCQG